MTPEFGPDGYLHCLPFTSVPVADLSQINHWVAERQQRRFAETMIAPPDRSASQSESVSLVH